VTLDYLNQRSGQLVDEDWAVLGTYDSRGKCLRCEGGIQIMALIEHGLFGPEADNWGYVMGGVYTVPCRSTSMLWSGRLRPLPPPCTIRCFSA
jgi:hypothetical protein